MCDTILAMPNQSAARAMLFGKNSDRHRNEAQTVEYMPRAEYAHGATVTCTYLTIPQARVTHAVLLCRPFWIWGAEMGANEHGVVIGNEGIHARTPAPQSPALVGMDLLRLTLERAGTAAQAVDVLTGLLQEHGQGGNCGYLIPSYYNNGFMIADATDAFVVETLGREWLVEKVQDVRGLSNCFSIGQAQRVSAGLPTLIEANGWDTQASASSAYADIIADPNREHLGQARARLMGSTSLLRSRAPRLTALDLMSILRDHGDGHGFRPQWDPVCATRCTLCMHAGVTERPGQTVGSMVSEIGRQGAVHWVTGTAAPCLSIFKPVLLDAPLPAHGPLPTDRFDEKTLWWRHERLHRAALRGDFSRFIEELREERDAMEAEFQVQVQAVVHGGSVDDRRRIVAQCWKEALAAEDRWYRHMDLTTTVADAAYLVGWDDMNRHAGLILGDAQKAGGFA